MRSSDVIRPCYACSATPPELLPLLKPIGLRYQLSAVALSFASWRSLRSCSPQLEERPQIFHPKSLISASSNLLLWENLTLIFRYRQGKVAIVDYSLSEAARLLGITPRTMTTWLNHEGIIPADTGLDHRERRITVEQLRQIGSLHHRPFIVPYAELSLDSLASRMDMLERSLQLLQRKLDHLGGGLAERVLRSAHEDHGLHAADVASVPPLGVVQVVVQEAIALVNAAPHVTANLPNEIYVTFQGKNDIFDLFPLMRGEWRRTLERAMRRGWHVIHLIRQTDDLEHAMTVAEDMTQLLRGPRGAYLPLFTPPMTTTSAKLREFVAVPGVGMLELKVAKEPHIDALIRYGPGEQFDRHYALLRRTREASKPVVMTYPPLSVEFSRAIHEAEAAEGDRYLVMNGLSELTIPLSIHRERADKILAQRVSQTVREKVRELLAIRTKRQAVFEQQIQRWHYRDICPMQAIRRYLRTGFYSPDDVFGALGAPPLTPEQRVHHLTGLIQRLEMYPNYELGLVDEVLDASIYQTFWLIKVGGEVLLECQSRNAGAREEIDLAVKEPHIIDAFRERHLRLWAQLVPAHRDKEQVIAWLRAQMAEIPASV
jgi:hypothetical protein